MSTFSNNEYLVTSITVFNNINFSRTCSAYVCPTIPVTQNGFLKIMINLTVTSYYKNFCSSM